jgi:hypothetical protein
MLSNTSRFLTYSCAVLYGVAGALLFIFPETLAPVFAWKVTPFMVMTIGAWSLGNAWLAFINARRWNWSLNRTSLLYLWLFGIGELLVLFAFREKLILQHPIAWLYLVTLIVNTLTAFIGATDYFRLRPANAKNGDTLSSTQKIPAVLFVFFVGFLGAYGIVAQIGAVGTNGGIFPEIMSLFTLRSFGVFYFSLALAVIPFFWQIGHKTVLHHAFASYGLIVFITVAAFANLSLFNFSQHPGGLLYFGAYLIVGIPLAFLFRKYGTG